MAVGEPGAGKIVLLYYPAAAQAQLQAGAFGPALELVTAAGVAGGG